MSDKSESCPVCGTVVVENPNAETQEVSKEMSSQDQVQKADMVRIDPSSAKETPRRKIVPIICGIAALAAVVIGIFVLINTTGKQTPDNISCNTASSNDEFEIAEETAEIADAPKLLASRFLRAYPESIVDFRNGMLIFADGTSMIFDDNVEKDFVTKKDNADPEDMLSIEYVDYDGKAPEYLHDAGRIRCDALMKKIYGNTKEEVKKQLTTIDWFGTKVLFSTTNGAADSLNAVKAELLNHPEFMKYVEKTAGTFNWRTISGSTLMSPHSYGIAIDINTKYSSNWLWDAPHATETDRIGFRNSIPSELVHIFKNHGFIWGGNWYHYDTMHFEFRPELIN